MADLMEVITDRHCRATSKQSQARCRRWASPGQHVCAIHGGKSPRAIVAAERRQAVAKVRDALVKLGVPIEAHPIEVLLEQVAEANGNVAFLRERVQQLDLPAGLNTAALALLTLYSEERDRVAKMAKLALDAGVEERKVQLEARRAELTADLIRHVLDHPDLALSLDQRQVGRRVAAGRLRLMEWQGTEGEDS